MTDQPSRRRPSQPAPRPVGAPNVLSNQATPNTLSTMAGGTTPAAQAADGRARRAAANVPGAPPTISTGRPVARGGQASATDGRFERPRRRPTLGTVIFIGFVVVWAARLFNGAGFGSDGTSPTFTPRPTTAPRVTVAPPSPRATVRPTLTVSPAVTARPS